MLEHVFYTSCLFQPAASEGKKGQLMNTNNDVINWLLDSEIPTIRTLTGRYLQSLPADNPQVVADRAAIMTAGPVPAILAHQAENGAWAGENSYYTPKYTSTHWSLTLLAELHIDGADPRFQRGVDHMLATKGPAIVHDLAEEKTGFSCFWGNLLRYAHHAGRGDHEIIQAMLHYAARDIHTGCQCLYNYELACGWGVSRTLWGLAAVPPAQRSAEVQDAIAAGIDFLLAQHSLAAADYPTHEEESQVHPLWFRLNFPLFYQADILFTLRVLAELNALDRPGAQPALDWLRGKRQKSGRWRGSSPYRRRTWPEMGDPPETGRWVTLFSLLILKQAENGPP
jgi:hypothetical protein